MIETTPQEQLALITIAVLIISGASVRMIGASAADEALRFSAEAADTLSDGKGTELREQVATQLAEEDRRAKPLDPGERLNPNRASAEELDRLPGVGPGMADRIVEFRSREGPFRYVDDLAAVQGIGPRLVERIRESVTLGDRPAASGSGVRIDLNRADEDQLSELPGIGPALARRIVEYRDEHGAFKEWGGLEAVSGIGPGLRRRLESAARLGP